MCVKENSSVFFPIISRNNVNNDSTSNPNKTSDSDSSVLSKKKFAELDLKYFNNDDLAKSSKPKQFSNFKTNKNKPK